MIRIFRSFILSLALISPLALAACGEGWNSRPYEEREPYTMERTAGQGIEYVRGAMMQEKGANLAPAQEDHVKVMKTESIEHDAPPAATDEDAAIVQEADHVFTSKQRK